MQRLNLSWFANLGLALAAVVFKPDEMDVLKQAMPFYDYLADPKKCLLDLEATRPHVWAIMEEIKKLNLAPDNDRPALLAARKAAINDIALRLNGTLASELAVAQAYHVTRKGAFNLLCLSGMRPRSSQMRCGRRWTRTSSTTSSRLEGAWRSRSLPPQPFTSSAPRRV